jgi:hypothetical protein
VATTDAIQIVRLRNNTSKAQEVWFEPLGEATALQPGVLYELRATDEFGPVEIDLADDGFSAYGWVTSLASIDDQGNSHVEWELPDVEAPNEIQRPA